MKKKIRKTVSYILLITLLIILIFPETEKAAVQGSYGVDLSRSSYNNKYSKPECTWYVQGRAHEKLGINLPWSGNANQWDENCQNYGYQVGTVAKANSILVENYEPYGHVFFVEKVENGYAYVTESNFNGCDYREDVINLSTMTRNGWSQPLSNVKFIYLDLDNEAPIIDTKAKISDVSGSGFTISYSATDNNSVSQAYALVWTYGQNVSNATEIIGTLNGNNASVRVNSSNFGGFNGTYYVLYGARDSAGNYIERNLIDPIKLYSINTSETGAYETKKDTNVHDEPYEEIHGKNTTRYTLSKGEKVSVVGYYINEWGAKYYQTSDEKWVYADDMSYRLQWSDVWNWIQNCFQKIIYFFAGQPCYATSGSASYVMVDGSLYAKHEGGSSVSWLGHTVYFDANGGSVNTSSRTVIEGNSYGTLPTPYRFGYSFDGWFTSADGGSLITSGTSAPTYDITLFAHWTRIVLLEGSCGPNLHYILYGDGEMIVTGSGEMTSHPWTNSYAERVLTVSLPAGMTSFCDSAFSGCRYMYQINIPEVKSIPSNCFYNCTALESISLPESITSIGENAFAYSGLKSLVLPEHVQTLGYGMLSNTEGVKEIVIPASVTRMSKIDSIHRTSSALEYSGLEKVIFESGTQNINDGALGAATKVKEVILPNTIKSIGNMAFSNTALTELVLPDKLESIGYGILSGNSGVKKLVVPSTVTTFQQYVYKDTENNTKQGLLTGSSVEELIFEEGIKTMGTHTCVNCKTISKVTIPNTITEVGKDSFLGCTALESISLPESITSIGENAFAQSALITICGVPESYAETWAVEHGFSFLALTEPIVIKGDINNDGIIDANDITALARHTAKISTITDVNILSNCCDVDGDGSVGASDVTRLARYVAKLITEL